MVFIKFVSREGRETIQRAAAQLTTDADAANWQKRGTFTSERDDALASRFYFHVVLCRKPYEDCLYELNKEFFLSPNVISQKLLQRSEYVKELAAIETSVTELRKQYANFNWTVMRVG